MDYLPQEIVLDILSRLPVTSILQFKHVCKAWLNTAQNPLLASMHFSNTGKNDPRLILHCENPIRNQLYSLELSSRQEEKQKVNKIRVPTLPECNVVGSCKGLLCLRDSSTKNKPCVYNPFTGDYSGLPKPTDLDFNIQHVVFGFGLHPTSNKYNVVKIAYYKNRQRSEIATYCYWKSEVRILTVGSQAWKSLGRAHYYLIQGPSQVWSMEDCIGVLSCAVLVVCLSPLKMNNSGRSGT